MATTTDRPISLVSLQKSTNKKSFDYKMCKKVAELTQVVHMLFTKSHEKDIELELTKKAYEQEIAAIISDAQVRIRKVKMSCEDEQRRSEQRLTELHSEQVRDLQGKVLQYTEKLEECARDILKKKKEISDLKSRLSVTQPSGMCNNLTEPTHSKGGQHLRSEIASGSRPNKDLPIVSNQQSSSSSDGERMEHVKQQCLDLEQMLRERDADIERLKQLKINIEKENLKVKTELTEMKKDKDHLDTSYNARISALQNELSESSRTQSKLQQKVKTLENELKAQQKELQKAQLESSSRSRFSSSPRQLTSTDNISKNENSELERMRRELERYRLELSNREGNFNRMFTNSNPVRVDSRLKGLSLGMTRQKSVNMGSSASNLHQKHLTTTHTETQKEKDSTKRLPLLAMEGRSKTSTNLKHGSATGNTAMQLRDRSIARKTDMFQQAF